MTRSIARDSIVSGGAAARRPAVTGLNLSVAQPPFSFPVAPADRVFVPPKSGYWKFIAWGPGGAGQTSTSAGASGSYGEVTRFLTSATPVTVSVRVNANTVLTFADGSVATAGKASAATPGAATGFDLALGGTAGVGDGTLNGNPGLGPGGGAGGTGQLGPGSGGAGAPGTLNYPGGVGAGANSAVAGIGGGGEESSTNSQGQGHVLAVFVRA